MATLPRCYAPHSVVAGDNPRTGIGCQRTRRSRRGPQKPRLPTPCMQTLLVHPRELSAWLPCSWQPVASLEEVEAGCGAAQASTGQPRCLTAHSTPITASMTTPTTTLPAVPTRKSGSQGQRTGDPGAGDRSSRGLGHQDLTRTRERWDSFLMRSLRKDAFRRILEIARDESSKC